jgi:thiosulfate dehydrogenase [quinone] large subunit
MPSRNPPPRKRIDPRDPRSRPRPVGAPYAPPSSGAAPGRAPLPEEDLPDSTRRVYLALLPLRVFLGGMLLYAGVDKLIDPAFLHAAGPGSIAQQLEGFTHASPLTPLIQAFALPFPVAIGLLIALVEIAVGLGALTGLLYRLSAAGGFALSILFWLTASWETRPIYYGPDLPYAIGWLTLALAGSGGLYTLRSWFDRLTGTVDESGFGYGAASQERRALLQAAALGIVAVGIAGVAGVFGRVVRRDEVAESAANGSTGTTPLSSTGPSAAPSAADAAGSALPSDAAASSAAGGSSGGVVIGTVSQLRKGQAYEFQDPNSGDPAVIMKLANDHVVAYDAVCTHQGCTVGYDSASGLLMCPCHGAVFDPTHDAAVVAGPTNVPLTSLPLHIDSATGKITLKA